MRGGASGSPSFIPSEVSSSFLSMVPSAAPSVTISSILTRLSLSSRSRSSSAVQVVLGPTSCTLLLVVENSYHARYLARYKENCSQMH